MTSWNSTKIKRGTIRGYKTGVPEVPQQWQNRWARRISLQGDYVNGDTMKKPVTLSVFFLAQCENFFHATSCIKYNSGN
jgi:hypothetical protein